MGSSFSAEISDTRELASVFLDTFDREYEKLYYWCMVRRVGRALERDAALCGGHVSACWRLYHAPFVPTPLAPRDSVMAAKLSKHLKRWNPRLLVLRGDFMLDYYERRADLTEGRRPLGTVRLCGVAVSRDATRAEEMRRDGLAALCAVPPDALPPPPRFPPHTLELHHARRGTVRLQFPAKERWEMWGDILQRAHWLAARLEHDDAVHTRAFAEAFRRARVACGLPDVLEFGGGETGILHDAIGELVDAKVLPKLLARGGDMGWKERTMHLQTFRDRSDELLQSYVSGKWHAIQGRTIGRRVLIEARVQDQMEAIHAFVLPIREEVHNYTNKATRAFLHQRVESTLRKLAADVTPTLSAVYAKAPKLYTACVSQGKVHYETREDHMFLASQYNGIGDCYDAERELWGLTGPIAAVREHFNGRVYEWLVVERSVVRLLRRIVANSVFTFETVFERNKAQRPWDDALREVRGLVEADSRTAIPHALEELLFETVIHFFRDEHVRPSLTSLKATMITPLEGRVPEELRSFVNAQEIVVDVLCDNLREMCKTIAESSLA